VKFKLVIAIKPKSYSTLPAVFKGKVAIEPEKPPSIVDDVGTS